MTFSTSYWVFDGQKRDDWETGYGFKIKPDESYQFDPTKDIRLSWTDHITFRYIEIEQYGQILESIRHDALYGAFVSEILVQYSYIHDFMGNGILLNGENNTVEYSKIANSYGYGGTHSQGIQLFADYVRNMTIRNNIFQDIRGTAAISYAWGTDGLNVYGNIFYNTPGSSGYTSPATIVDISDPDPGRSFSFSVESDISKIMYSINDYELYLRPVHNFYGNSNVILTARDSCIYQSSDTFAVEILPVNDSPVIYNLPRSITFSAGSSYELRMKDYVMDYDTPDSLLVWTFQPSNNLLTYEYDPETSILLLTSNESDGEADLVCTVTDDSLASAVESITITITKPFAKNINYKNQEHNFQLHNYLNPFDESTNFLFTLTEPNEVQIKIYDIVGREVETLYNGYCEAGKNEIIWHPKNFLRGIYICSIQIFCIQSNTTRHYTEQKKIIDR